jgi:flagellar biosynthesis protein FliR
MIDLATWLMVFLRASSMLAIFPVFSARGFPVQIRLALGALLSAMVAVTLPAAVLAPDFLGVLGQMAVEIGVGLLLGFGCQIVFFILEVAGAIVAVEMGVQTPPALNPLSNTQMTAPATMLYYLGALLWLCLDMHHGMIICFVKTYQLVPIGVAHLQSALMEEFISRTGAMFGLALQMAAPLLAVSFVISLVFSLLGRAVPQMNVFAESFAVRPLVGLSVFGATLELTAQHISNYLHHLPQDMLRVAQFLH